MRPLIVLVTCIVMHITLTGAGREVAITIDDLPRGGDGGPRTPRRHPRDDGATPEAFSRSADSRHRIRQRGPARPSLAPTACARSSTCGSTSGADLGNHSYSHLNINNVPLDEYTADIVRGEPMLRAALAAHSRTLRFYRHPFLFTGPTPEIKKGMQDFLDRHGYRVAPVTLDDADYQFAALYTRPEYRERVRAAYVPYMESIVAFFEARSIEVVGREFPQVLLIHANQLNADLMPDLLAMFRRRGYTFVTLERALEDEAYRLPDDYAGRGGFSWIHRWARTKGMPPKGEPDPPPWVQEASSR